MELLQQALRHAETHLCLGLDPVPEKLPERYWLRAQPVRDWCIDVLQATRNTVAVYKPNLAFFEAIGPDGVATLAEILQAERGGVPVIADAKRGDIGNTSKAYARLVFEHLDMDAITLAPYMGADSLQPFLETERPSGKPAAAFVLALTSNPGSADFQRLDCGGKALYHRVLDKVSEWNRDWAAGRLGAVVGATHAAELAEVAALHPELPLLVPGLGSQGGDLQAVLEVLRGKSADTPPHFVNVSRAILYGEDGNAEPEAVAARCAEWATRLACSTKDAEG